MSRSSLGVSSVAAAERSARPSPELPAVIETARLVLRRPTLADAPALVARWASDPEATRYMLFATYAEGDVAAGEAFLELCLAAWASGRGHLTWVITERGGDGPIGMLGVTRAAPHCCEIGYILGRAWWGRGYVSEAVTEVVSILFADPAVWRVYAPTHIDNAASQRVLAKVGFKREATHRRHHVFPSFGPEPQHCSLWAITRDDIEGAPP